MEKYLDQSTKEEFAYWIVPIQSTKEKSAEDIIEHLVGKRRIYALRKSTSARGTLKAGDWLCFYATRKGIIGHAQVTSGLKKNVDSKVIDHKVYPWIVYVGNSVLYFDKPLVIDENIRKNLEAFNSERKLRIWAWFVHAMHKITEHDFNILTRQQIMS